MKIVILYFYLGGVQIMSLNNTMSKLEQYRFRQLTWVLDKLKTGQLTGRLICQSGLRQYELYFINGVIVHAVGEGQTGDEVLYGLLNWTDGTLTIEEGPRTSEYSLDRNQLGLFHETIKILQSRGLFDYDVELNQTQPVAAAPLKVNIASPSAAEKAPIRPAPSNPKTEQRYPNLLLPPGTAQTQMEELLGHLPLRQQLEALTRARFTGYVYYRPVNAPQGSNRQDNFGLIVLINGTISDIVYAGNGWTSQEQGLQAYQTLSSVKVAPEIYKVDLRILKAYRTLLAYETPIREFQTSQTNFAGVIAAFKQSNRDGVVIIYADSLKLHCFFLFEQGLQVGVFGSDFKSERLQELSALGAFPITDVTTSMTVMLAKKITAFDLPAPLPVPSNSTSSSQEMAIPLFEAFENKSSKPDKLALPEALNWNSTLNSGSNKRKEKPVRDAVEVDDANPFDF